MAKLADIQQFLSQKQIAIIGVSRNPKDLSRLLCTELGKRGCEVLAVNPTMTELDGKRCYSTIKDIDPAPGAALIMTGTAVLENVVEQCREAGVRSIWIYGTNGRSKVSALSSAACRLAGITLVEGECPYMFLQGSGGIHRLHGFVRKVFRSYPA